MSELSVLELEAQHSEVLPEREALGVFHGSFSHDDHGSFSHIIFDGHNLWGHERP
jgi:hypothetical protein